MGSLTRVLYEVQVQPERDGAQAVQPSVLTSVAIWTSAGSDDVVSCFLPDRYGSTRSSTCGSSSHGTSSRILVLGLAFAPVFPPTNTSTASTIWPSIRTFFPSSPMSAVR